METKPLIEPGSPFDWTGRKRSHRSKAGNGRLLLTEGRSAIARRFRDLVHDIAADLGGMSELSTAEVQLVRRASMLSAECERHEARAAEGDKGFSRDDFIAYVTATNALKRFLEVIGVKRRSKDCTPRLSDYLEAKAAIEPVAPVIEADWAATLAKAAHEPTRQCPRRDGRSPFRCLLDSDRGRPRLTMVNAMNRVFAALGLKRPSKDCTPTLPDYLAAVEAITVEASQRSPLAPLAPCRP